MDDAVQMVVARWLQKAANDLRTAETMLSVASPVAGHFRVRVGCIGEEGCMMTHDDLIQEVRTRREALLAAHGGDVHLLIKTLMTEQGEKLVHAEARRCGGKRRERREELTTDEHGFSQMKKA